MSATGQRRPRAHKIRVFFAGLAVGLVTLFFGLLILYRFIPPVSTLMLARMVTGRPVNRRWMPLAQISPFMQASVIMSEDGQFCHHHGVDWRELGQSIHEAEDGERARGASTITMQTAKNLFLWPARSYVRKALEIPMALLIDAAWGKQRVLEIYLNVAQWGNGTFGVEAAARRYFRIDAADLTPRQAALLAAAIPNPLDRNPARPDHRLAAIAAIVRQRLYEAPAHLTCLPRVRTDTSHTLGFGVSARP